MEISTVISHSMAIHAEDKTPIYLHIVGKIGSNKPTIQIFVHDDPQYDKGSHGYATKTIHIEGEWVGAYLTTIVKALENEGTPLEVVKAVKTDSFTILHKIMQYVGAL